MKAKGAKNCNFQPRKSIREAIQKGQKGGFYKVNGANNKEVGSVYLLASASIERREK